MSPIIKLLKLFENQLSVYYLPNLNPDLEITCTGVTGHGSLLIDNTAGEKLRYIIDKFMDFREEEKNKLLNNANLTLGDVTTVNLMIVNVSLYFSHVSRYLLTLQLHIFKLNPVLKSS